MPLREVRTTERGFEIVEFSDLSRASCSLQQSSLAQYKDPGASAVWLGTKGLGHRMHLDVVRVHALIAHLQAWLDTGSFELEGGDPP